MSRDPMERLLSRLDKAWTAFQESYAGLSDTELQEPGVTGDWSVKDVLAHVSIWEEEALKYLPLIIEGGRPPRYATVGGIDAFNARMIQEKRGLSVIEVRRQLDETHARLRAFVRAAPAGQLTRETRARRRLRLDTYGHYPEHTAAIRSWRERTGRLPMEPPASQTSR
ncbi:MAG: maleylpyruvate isomerase N-terminal domain-containing protein [Chloroflexota bacterium]|nr:maleylpyruvate isomerase N-terminal domain-containing protein [Chloroflexota bacterium]